MKTRSTAFTGLADLVLQLGTNPRVPAADQRALLDALGRQVAPAGVSYHFGEPERLARAVYFLDQQGDLDDRFWDEWFAKRGEAAPLASWVNGLAELRRGRVPER